MFFAFQVPLVYESHGGEDVGVWAAGVNSALFTGSMEQSYIAMAMACAAGMTGPSEVASELKILCSNSAEVSMSSVLLISLILHLFR